MRETIQNANGKQFHAVSLSGGKDSTAMLLLMIERDMPINMVLSADTGMEFPEMYEHLAKLDEHLFRERGIELDHIASVGAIARADEDHVCISSTKRLLTASFNCKYHTSRPCNCTNIIFPIWRKLVQVAVLK